MGHCPNSTVLDPSEVPVGPHLFGVILVGIYWCIEQAKPRDSTYFLAVRCPQMDHGRMHMHDEDNQTCLRDDWSRLCITVSSEQVRILAVFFCCVVLLNVGIYLIYAICLCYTRRSINRVMSFGLVTLGLSLSFPQALVRIGDPHFNYPSSIPHLVLFAVGDIIDHVGILMLIYWDICTEAVHLVYALDPKQHSCSLRRLKMMGIASMLSQVFILGSLFASVYLLERHEDRCQTFTVFTLVQVGAVFGCAPTVAFGMLVRGLHRLWNQLPGDVPRRLVHRLRYTQLGLGTLMLLCASFVPSAVLLGTVPFFQVKAGFLYVFVVLMLLGLASAVLLLGELILTLKSIRSKANRPIPLSPAVLEELVQAGTQQLAWNNMTKIQSVAPVWDRGCAHAVARSFLDLMPDMPDDQSDKFTMKTTDLCMKLLKPMTLEARCSVWESMAMGFPTLAKYQRALSAFDRSASLGTSNLVMHHYIGKPVYERAMSYSEVSQVVNHILLEYEIDSSSGCLPLLHRTNLLVDLGNTQFHEDQITVLMNQWMPEGFGFNRFWHDTMYVPGDKPCESDLHLLWNVQRQLPPKNVKLWLFQVYEDPCDVRTFHFDDQSFWAHVDTPHREHEVLHHLELFAGGMGGWTSTLDLLCSMTPLAAQSIGVEKELNIATSFALNHAAALLQPNGPLPLDFPTLYDGNWIICDDVRAWNWLPPLTKWGVDLVTISSPCPSWSVASSSEGLWKEDGQLFIHSILKCRFLLTVSVSISCQLREDNTEHGMGVMLIVLALAPHMFQIADVRPRPAVLLYRTNFSCMPLIYLLPIDLHCVESRSVGAYRYYEPPFCHHGILPTHVINHNKMLATRIGEASHPGPVATTLTFAITNPTSIHSKPQQYAELIADQSLDVVSASETAATKVVQRNFASSMKTVGFRSLWSVPLEDRVARSDGMPSYRGKASGVALFSSQSIRRLQGTIDDYHASTSRLGHFFLEIDRFQLQIVVIYGLAMSGSTRANSLLINAALAATDHFHLPWIIMGDFNADPASLVPEDLEDRQVTDLKALHVSLTGFPMPPTCKGITTPDNALFSPESAAWVRNIRVLPAGHFDTHNVVTFQLCIPELAMCNLRLPMPLTWVTLPIDQKFMSQSYDDALLRHGVPQTFQEWGQCIETAVDTAYRSSQQANEGLQWSLTKPLPKQCRGRCQPRQPQMASKYLWTKPGRPGDYTPSGEIVRRRTQCRIKQVRRVQALYRRVCQAQKYEPTAGQIHEMQLEWNAILRCKAFDGCQVKWCQCMPELGPPPLWTPQVDYLGTMFQLLKFQTDADVAFDQQLHKQRLVFARDLDRRFAGSKNAFAAIKEAGAPPLVEMQQEICATAVIVPHAGSDILAYCEGPERFDFASPVLAHEVPCKLLSKDAYSLLLQPLAQTEIPEHAELMQKQTKTDPQAMMAMLRDYWLPFWFQPNPTLEVSVQFEAMLSELTQHLPGPAMSLTDDTLWQDCVRTLKVPSTRGIDAISSQELQMLPPLALTHIRDVILSLENGFPAWMMTAITVAIPKVETVPTPGQIRPITVLAQLYRLWGKYTCKQLLAHMALHFPAEVSGFLASRGPTDSYLRQQWQIELAHEGGQGVAGLSADLLKCFNTIGLPMVFRAFEWLGFPMEVIRLWYASLRKLTRVWKIGQHVSEPMDVNHGCPEGDSWSVASILALSYVWVRLLRCKVPQSFISAYADNWIWMAATGHEHAAILDITNAFVSSTHMQIDWLKTWAWATSGAKFDMLLVVLKNRPETAGLQRRLNACDLGAQLTYQGVPNLGKHRSRLEKVHARLLRLQRVPHSLQTKILLVKNAIYPAAFYGIEVLPLGDSHTKKLRTAISNALLGPCPSRNPALALAGMPALFDPFLELLLRVIGAIRRMLFKTTDLDRRRRWLQYAWDTDVLLHHTDRKSLPRHMPLNTPDTQAVLKKFSPTDLHHILQELSGAYQTEHQKAKWAADADGTCRYCHQCDSKYHRFYECPASEPVRERFADSLQYFMDEGMDIHELPFFVATPAHGPYAGPALSPTAGGT
eukprot:s1780_g3.t1